MRHLIIGKEFLALIRDGRLLALGLAVLVVSVGVLGVASVDSERRQAEKLELEHATRAQWDHQGEKHPHRGAHFGLYVFAPESVLSAFDPGVQRYLGQTIWLEPHRRNLARLSLAADDPMHGRFGEFTAAFMLAVVVPLLLFAASYGAIAGERETGTLRMVRGMGTHLPAFVWSKVVALAAAVGVIVILPFVVMLLASGEVGRTAMLAAAYLLYCSIFIAVGLTISAVSRTSRQAFVVLVALWLLLVWIVPRAGAALASSSVELPTAGRFWSEIRRDYQQGLPGDGDLSARSLLFDEQLLKRYGVTRLEDLPFGAYAVRRLNRDAYADRVHELHFDRLWQRFADQESMLRYISAFSPAIAIRLASMKLAGTDLHQRKSFEDAAELYRRYFNAHIDRWDAENSQGLRSFEDRYGHDQLWQSVERFEYRAPGSSEVLGSIVPELGILSAWAAAAFGLLTLVTYRVRT